MPEFKDQTGRKVIISNLPQKIVSLVPSQTELLHDLGLEDEVKGITKFCIRPERWFRNKIRVGGTKSLKINKIHEIEPDLIIANKEENTKEQIEELAENYPIWVSDVANLEDACSMIEQVGLMTAREQQSEKLLAEINHNFLELSFPLPNPKSVYLIWKRPLMTIGGDTFISSLMERGGFCNIYKDHLRYPEINDKELKDSGCEVLLLPSEPFPFKEKHLMEFQSLLPDTKILLVDGEMFSWYGSRLRYIPAYFKFLWRGIKDMS